MVDRAQDVFVNGDSLILEAVFNRLMLLEPGYWAFAGLK